MLLPHKDYRNGNSVNSETCLGVYMLDHTQALSQQSPARGYLIAKRAAICANNAPPIRHYTELLRELSESRFDGSNKVALEEACRLLRKTFPVDTTLPDMWEFGLMKVLLKSIDSDSIPQGTEAEKAFRHAFTDYHGKYCPLMIVDRLETVNKRLDAVFARCGVTVNDDRVLQAAPISNLSY